MQVEALLYQNHSVKDLHTKSTNTVSKSYDHSFHIGVECQIQRKTQAQYWLKPTNASDHEDCPSKAQKMPNIVLSSQKTGLNQSSILEITGMQETTEEKFKVRGDMSESSPSRTLAEFKKGLNPKKTDVGSYTIEIALLKSSKLG